LTTPAEPRPAGTARSFDVVEGPYLVSRINPHPFRQLRGGEPADPLLRTLAELEREREDLREPLLEALHRAAPELGGHRSAALAAKRAVFNGRPPRADLHDHPLTREVPLLGAWTANWHEALATAALVDSGHEAGLSAERAVLAEWARDPAVDRSTALSSPDLHRAVVARAATDEAPNKRMRKAEAALVRYFSRSTVKVSPYSMYTAVHFAPVEDLDAEGLTRAGGPLRLTSHAELRRLLPRQAARTLAATVCGRWSLTPSAAQRLASDAQLQFILASGTEVLGVSWPTDSIPAHVRIAVAARDQGCRFPGCQAPIHWCDLHHVIGREDGGPTTVSNLVALCRRHHTAVTHGRWHLSMTPDGIVTVRRGRHTATTYPRANPERTSGQDPPGGTPATGDPPDTGPPDDRHATHASGTTSGGSPPRAGPPG
jgi:hypothetical protein